MDKRIIINADDFGLCQGVNKAIVTAHTEGILTSATVMANMPAAQDAVKLARKLPKLGTGLHLNLTEGRPISKDKCVECILDTEGQFAFSDERLAWLSLINKKIRCAITAELAAQIQWAIDNGLKITHLDSHKHIHSFPVIFSVIIKLTRLFDIDAVRYTYEPKQLSSKPWPLPSEGGRKRAKLIRVMARINRFQDSTLFKTDCLLGVAHTGKIDVNFYKSVALYNSAEITEIMTHPGFMEGLESTGTRLLRQREIELEALCSPKTKQYFKDAGIKLVHYGQLQLEKI